MERIDDPQPGFWLLRCVKGGPLVPARLYWDEARDPDSDEPLDRPRHIRAEIAGEPVEDPFAIWHTKRTPITESDFNYRTDLIRWARRNRPDMPECHPRRRVKLLNLPPVGAFGD